MSNSYMKKSDLQKLDKEEWINLIISTKNVKKANKSKPNKQTPGGISKSGRNIRKRTSSKNTRTASQIRSRTSKTSGPAKKSSAATSDKIWKENSTVCGIKIWHNSKTKQIIIKKKSYEKSRWIKTSINDTRYHRKKIKLQVSKTFWRQLQKTYDLNNGNVFPKKVATLSDMRKSEKKIDTKIWN